MRGKITYARNDQVCETDARTARRVIDDIASGAETVLSESLRDESDVAGRHAFRQSKTGELVDARLNASRARIQLPQSAYAGPPNKVVPCTASLRPVASLNHIRAPHGIPPDSFRSALTLVPDNLDSGALLRKAEDHVLASLTRRVIDLEMKLANSFIICVSKQLFKHLCVGIVISLERFGRFGPRFDGLSCIFFQPVFPPL
jgi:hypothetical protein